MLDDDFELPDDLAALADTAAAALADMGEEYADEAAQDADRLVGLAEAVLHPQSDEAWDAAMADVFSLAHNFKGQGQTFGYDLVTKIGEVLSELSRPANNPKRENSPQMMRMAAALHAILHQRLTGDGGQMGARLCSELDIPA